ncbi:uncharacterized protein BJX67DRAFT_339724 [Aspergillus lucknowensis]|uniref:Uncharacterized protein n=1 Tax=Aspergillus lucknowensis TaxID=176173 RepID=A0ABR4M7I3_9EURO
MRGVEHIPFRLLSGVLTRFKGDAETHLNPDFCVCSWRKWKSDKDFGQPGRKKDLPRGRSTEQPSCLNRTNTSRRFMRVRRMGLLKSRVTFPRCTRKSVRRMKGYFYSAHRSNETLTGVWKKSLTSGLCWGMTGRMTRDSDTFQYPPQPELLRLVVFHFGAGESWGCRLTVSGEFFCQDKA